RFRFEIDMLERSLYKKIIGVSFTIDAPRQMGYSDAPCQMVYMCGNIEEGFLMKMLTKTGIQILGVDYGNLKPPPKKFEGLEAPSDGTETQPKKDREPPPPKTVFSSSVKQREKKTRNLA
ncbi:hypothetical protein HID58_043630, partial [Brassica napus]